MQGVGFDGIRKSAFEAIGGPERQKRDHTAADRDGRHDPPRRDDDLTHYAMLYRRALPGLDRDEFLLVTGEDYGPSEFCVTYAIGLDLTTADLDIT